MSKYDLEFAHKVASADEERIKNTPRIEGHTYCPHCGADLDHEGIGYDSHCFQIEYPDGCMGDLEIGDTEEYYCPVCGKQVPDDDAWELIKKWHGE